MPTSTRSPRWLSATLVWLSLGSVGWVGCDSAGPVVDPTAELPGGGSTSSTPSVPEIDDAFRDLLDRGVQVTLDRNLSPQRNNAWQIVHALLAYGELLKLNDNGTIVPALDYVLRGNPVRGWTLVPDAKGVKSILEPGDKVGMGHEDQWLGYLSQCGVTLDTPLVVKGETFAIRDLLTQAQWDVRDGMEATWTLMGLATFLTPDVSWQARDGSTWNLERLLAVEVAQELDRAACGGSHRMYAIALAVRNYQALGLPLTGSWQAAADKVRDTIAKARAYQQADGSFSTLYFQRASTSADLANKISTTGHTFEFLALSLDDATLREPWMIRAATFLCEQLEATRELDLECGGLYHTAHGLRIYRDRLFGPATSTPSLPAPPAGVRPLASDDAAPPPPGLK